jgi:trehalose 6-phosphate phosphatase
MKDHVLGARGDAALHELMRLRPLLAFDFDGTLAPIVDRPQDARVSPPVAACLSALSQRLPVAVVTGRAVADVRTRLGFAPQHVVGNHGAEDELHAGVEAAALASSLDPLRALAAAQAEEFARLGVEVEDKGLSIALHYRRSHDPLQAQAQLRDLVARLPPTLQVFAGKMVVNAMAARAPDKADAVQRLTARCGAAAAFYVGDDVNDEPVFAAAPPQWVTVRIGHEDPASRAQFFLDGVHEMAPLLERLLAHAPSASSAG